MERAGSIAAVGCVRLCDRLSAAILIELSIRVISKVPVRGVSSADSGEFGSPFFGKRKLVQGEGCGSLSFICGEL
jgi:hypothetical protein